LRDDVSSSVLENIEKTAMQHLSDRMGRIVAKAIATAATKAGIATAVGKATNSSDIGLLTGLALFAMSRADTRSWLLLPERLQVVRLYLKPGTYKARIDYLNAAGLSLRSEEVESVSVKPLKATFIQRRAFQ